MEYQRSVSTESCGVGIPKLTGTVYDNKTSAEEMATTQLPVMKMEETELSSTGVTMNTGTEETAPIGLPHTDTGYEEPATFYNIPSVNITKQELDWESSDTNTEKTLEICQNMIPNMLDVDSANECNISLNSICLAQSPGSSLSEGMVSPAIKLCGGNKGLPRKKYRRRNKTHARVTPKKSKKKKTQEPFEFEFANDTEYSSLESDSILDGANDTISGESTAYMLGTENINVGISLKSTKTQPTLPFKIAPKRGRPKKVPPMAESLLLSSASEDCDNITEQEQQQIIGFRVAGMDSSETTGVVDMNSHQTNNNAIHVPAKKRKTDVKSSSVNVKIEQDVFVSESSTSSPTKPLQDHPKESKAKQKSKRKGKTRVGRPPVLGNFKCDRCDMVFRERQKMVKHRQKHVRPWIYCSYCDFKARCRESFMEHESKHTNTKPFKCELCPYASRSRIDLRRHQAKHSTVKNYKCPYCDFTTKWRRNVSHHLLSHVEDRPFHCEICGQNFKRSTDLKYHLYRHTSEKPLKCERCDFRCKTKYELDLHQLKHSDIRSFPCTYPGCVQACKTKSDLKKHMVVHCEERNYPCPLCGKYYKSASARNKHAKRHTNERPFKCDICNKGFKVKSSLGKHRVLHSGNRPYSCDVCGWTFSSKSNKDVHMKTHDLTDRPYRCPLCPHGAKSQHNLLAHVGTMHGNYAFFCELCQKPYKRHSQLQMHYKRMHSKMELEKLNSLETLDLTLIKGEYEEDESQITNKNEETLRDQSAMNCILKQIKKEIGEDELATGSSGSLKDDFSSNAEKQRDPFLEKRKRGRPKKKMNTKLSPRQKSIDDQNKASENTYNRQPENTDDSSHITQKGGNDQPESEISTNVTAETSPVTREERHPYPRKRKRGRPKKIGKTKLSSCKTASKKRKNDCLNTDKSEERELEKEENENRNNEEPNFKNMEGVGVMVCGGHQNVISKDTADESHYGKSADQYQNEPPVDSDIGHSISINKHPGGPAFSQKEVSSQKDDSLDNMERERQISNSQCEHLADNVQRDRQDNEHSIIDSDNEHKVQSDNKVVKSGCPINLSQKEDITGIVQTVKHSKGNSEYEVTNRQNEHSVDYNQKEHSLSNCQDGNQMLGHPIDYNPYETPVDYSLNRHSVSSSLDENPVDLSKKKQILDNSQNEQPVDYSMKSYSVGVNQIKNQENIQCEHPVDYSKKEHSTDMCKTEQPIKNSQMKQPADNGKFEHSVKTAQNDQPSDNGQSEQPNNNSDQPDETVDISHCDHLADNSRSDQTSDISRGHHPENNVQSEQLIINRRSDHPPNISTKDQSVSQSDHPADVSRRDRSVDVLQSDHPVSVSRSDHQADNVQKERSTNSSQSEVPVDNNPSEPTNSSQSEHPADNTKSEPTNSSQSEHPADNTKSEPTNSSQSEHPADDTKREPTNTSQSEHPADNTKSEPTNSSQSEQPADNTKSEPTNSSQSELPADNTQSEPTNSSQSELPVDNTRSELTNSSQSEHPADNNPNEPTNSKSEIESGNSQTEHNVNNSQREQNLVDYREEEHILAKSLHKDQVDNSQTKPTLVTSQIDHVVHNNLCERPIDITQSEHLVHNTQSHCLIEYSQNSQKELSMDTSQSEHPIDSSQCEQPLDNRRGEQPMNVGQSEQSVDNCQCEQVGNSKSEQPVNSDEVDKRLDSNQRKQLIDNSQCEQPVDYSKKEHLSGFQNEQPTDCNQTEHASDNGQDETSNGNSQMENSFDNDMTPNPQTSKNKQSVENTQSRCSKDTIQSIFSENKIQTLPIEESSNNHSSSISQSASEDPKEETQRLYKCQIESLKVISQDENSRDCSQTLCSDRLPEAMPETIANDNLKSNDLNYTGTLSVRCLDESRNGQLKDREGGERPTESVSGVDVRSVETLNSDEIFPRMESDLEKTIVSRMQESNEYQTNGSESEQTLINTDCVSGNNADTNKKYTENRDQGNPQEKLQVSDYDPTNEELGDKQDVRNENDNGIPVKCCISTAGDHTSSIKSWDSSEILSSDSREKIGDGDSESTTVLSSGDQELPSESRETPVKNGGTRVNAISSHSTWTKFDGNFRLPLATRGFRFNFNKTGKKPKCWFMELDAIVDEESKKHQLKYLRRKSKIVSAGNFQRKRRARLSGHNEMNRPVSVFRMNGNKNAKNVNDLCKASNKVEKSEDSRAPDLVDRPHPSPLDGAKVSQEELVKLNKSEGTMLKPKLSIVSNELSESCMKKAKGISATKKRLLPFKKKFIKLELDSEGNCIKSDETYPLEDTGETAEKTVDHKEALPKSGINHLSAEERAADCHTIDETVPKAMQEGSGTGVGKTDEGMQYSVTKEAAHETTGNSEMNQESGEDAEVVFSIQPISKSSKTPTNDVKKQPGGSIKFKLYEKIKQRKVEPPSGVTRDLTTDGEIMNHSGYDGTLTKQRKEAFVNKESRQCIVCLRDLLYGRDPCKVEDWPKKLTCQSCEFAKKASSELGNVPKNIYEKVDIGHINESEDGEVHVYVVKPPADKEIVRKSSNYSSAYGGYSRTPYPKADSTSGKIKTYVVSKETNKEASYTLTSIEDNDEDNSDDRCKCGTGENLFHRTDSSTLTGKNPDAMKIIYHPESFGCDDEPLEVKPNLETLDFQIQGDNQEPSDSAIPFATSSVGDNEVNDKTADRTYPNNAKDSDHPYPLYVVNTGESDGQEGSSEENINEANDHPFRYLGSETSGEANSNNNSVEAWENCQGEGNVQHSEGTKLYVFCDDVAAKRTGRENLDQNSMALWNDPCVMTVVEDLGDDTRLVNGQTEYVEAEQYLGRKIKVEKEDVDSDIPDLVDDPDKVETRHDPASHSSDQDIKPIPMYHMSGAGAGYHTQQGSNINMMSASTSIPDQGSQSSLPVILDVRSIKEEPDF